MISRKAIGFLFFLSIFSIGLLWPAETPAQQPTQAQAAKQELQRFQQRLDAVQEILRAYRNRKAEELVMQAQKLAEQAHEMFRRRRYMEARQTIMQAQRMLEEAIRTALFDPLRRLVSRLQVLMRKAESQVLSGGNFEAGRFLNKARDLQRKAEAARRRGELFQAVERYRLAIWYVEKALSYGQPQNAPITDVRMDMNQSERQRFENLAARVRTAVEHSGNRTAQTIFEQAQRQARKADDAYQSGRKQLALDLMNGAYRLLLRALDLASRQQQRRPAALQNELASLTEMLRRAESLQLQGAQGAVVLRRVRQNLRQAEQSLQQHRYGEAASYLKLARGLLTRILRGQQKFKGNARRLREEIRNLRIDIKAMEEMLGDMPNPQLRVLLRMARGAAKRAREQFQSGAYSAALQQVFVAQRLLSRAEKLAAGGRPQIGEPAAREHIAQLRQMLAEMEQSPPGSATAADVLLQQAHEFLNRAQKFAAQGNFLLAYEMADLGIEVVKRVFRSVRQD